MFVRSNDRSERSTFESFFDPETPSMQSAELMHASEELFDLLDQDENGHVDVNELRDMLRADHRYVTKTKQKTFFQPKTAQKNRI